MKGKDLLDGMGYIEDRFVEEAERETIRPRLTLPLRKWTALAACLALILLGVSTMGNLTQFINSTENLPERADGPAEDQMAIPNIHPESVLDDRVQTEQAWMDQTELPSLVLEVTAVTADGFRGVVRELTDTDLIDPGTELDVVLPDGIRIEMEEEDQQIDMDSTAFQEFKKDGLQEGMVVLVQFSEYDPRTGTIVAALIAVNGRGE